MNNNPRKEKNIKFLLLTVVLIFLSPWLYKFTFNVVGLKFLEASYIVIAITSILIGIIYLNLNAKLWLLLLCLVLLPPIAWELSSFISFEIHYANNDWHLEPCETCDWMPQGERYRAFNSYYTFAYGNEYWNGFMRHLKYEIIWLVTPFTYILAHKIFSKKNQPIDILDQ